MALPFGSAWTARVRQSLTTAITTEISTQTMMTTCMATQKGGIPLTTR